MNQKKIKGIGFYIALVVLLAVCAVWFLGLNQPKKVTYSDIIAEFESGNVESFVLKDNDLTICLLYTSRCV